MQEIVIVEPAFFSQFRCVGSACIDHCCKGWEIELDKPTVDRYTKSSVIEIRNISEDNIIVTAESENSWGKVQLTNHGNCSFLDKDRLCKVHKSLGEKALSTTCAIYPRLYGSFKYEIRSNLTLSCPEAARMLLTTPDAMLYSEKVKLSPDPLNEPDISQDDRLLNLMCTNIMISCGINLEEGFYGIIMLLLYRDKLAETDDMHEKLLDYFENILVAIQNGQIRKEISELHPDSQLQSALLIRLKNYISSKNRGRGGATLENYIQQLAEFQNRNPIENDFINPAKQLNRVWKMKAMPWLKEHPHLLSNYMQYRMYEDFFPVKNGRNPFTNLFMLMSEWFLLKLLIAASIELNANFKQEDIINIVYSYHSVTRHDKHAEDELLAEIEQVKIKDNFSLIYLLK